jgi:hypothetical protein
MHSPQPGMRSGTYNPIKHPRSSILLEPTFTVNLPAWLVVQSHKLTHFEHKLLLMITIYGNNQSCIYRNDTLARKLNSTNASIKQTISSLKKKGFLKAFSVDGKRHLAAKNPN